jgi:hypothetical protein
MAPAGGPGIIGDLAVAVRPGDTFLGRTYDRWRALPAGAHDLPPHGGDGHGRAVAQDTRARTWEAWTGSHGSLAGSCAARR